MSAFGAARLSRYYRAFILFVATIELFESNIAQGEPISERMSLAYGESFSVATLHGNRIVSIARTGVNCQAVVFMHGTCVTSLASIEVREFCNTVIKKLSYN